MGSSCEEGLQRSRMQTGTHGESSLETTAYSSGAGSWFLTESNASSREESISVGEQDSPRERKPPSFRQKGRQEGTVSVGLSRPRADTGPLGPGRTCGLCCPAVVTMPPTSGQRDNRLASSQPEAGGNRSRCGRGWFLLRPLCLRCRQPASPPCHPCRPVSLRGHLSEHVHVLISNKDSSPAGLRPPHDLILP